MFEQVHALRPGTTIVYSQASVNVIFLGVKKLLEDSGNIEWYGLAHVLARTLLLMSL